ncbi:hypothetical protein FRC08_004128 [Ceratobasidium sp. 394]|nr:hypothetical protein FRC08_004128 [Ceratobasidium sp. 394]
MPAPSLPNSTGTLPEEYEFRTNFPIPHTHYVHALSISTTSRWILSSSSGPHGNTVITVDTCDVSHVYIHYFPSKWMTCVCWVSDELFFAGFSNGTTCLGKLQGNGDEPIHIPNFSDQGAVTAIKSHPQGAYLASANA